MGIVSPFVVLLIGVHMALVERLMKWETEPDERYIPVHALSGYDGGRLGGLERGGSDDAALGADR